MLFVGCACYMIIVVYREGSLCLSVHLYWGDHLYMRRKHAHTVAYIPESKSRDVHGDSREMPNLPLTVHCITCATSAFFSISRSGRVVETKSDTLTVLWAWWEPVHASCMYTHGMACHECELPK